MEPELTLFNFLTEARRGLVAVTRSNIPERASEAALQHAEAGWQLREGTDGDITVRLRIARQAAERVLEFAVARRCGFMSDDLTHWEYQHTPAELHELWDEALQLVVEHGNPDPVPAQSVARFDDLEEEEEPAAAVRLQPVPDETGTARSCPA